METSAEVTVLYVAQGPPATASAASAATAATGTVAPATTAAAEPGNDSLPKKRNLKWVQMYLVKRLSNVCCFFC